jgi:hypothetical protein
MPCRSESLQPGRRRAGGGSSRKASLPARARLRERARLPERARLRELRLRLLGRLDQTTGRERSILRRSILSLERRLRRERAAGPGAAGRGEKRLKPGAHRDTL